MAYARKRIETVDAGVAAFCQNSPTYAPPKAGYGSQGLILTGNPPWRPEISQPHHGTASNAEPSFGRGSTSSGATVPSGDQDPRSPPPTGAPIARIHARARSLTTRLGELPVPARHKPAFSSARGLFQTEWVHRQAERRRKRSSAILPLADTHRPKHHLEGRCAAAHTGAKARNANRNAASANPIYAVTRQRRPTRVRRRNHRPGSERPAERRSTVSIAESPQRPQPDRQASTFATM